MRKEKWKLTDETLTLGCSGTPEDTGTCPEASRTPQPVAPRPMASLSSGSKPRCRLSPAGRCLWTNCVKCHNRLSPQTITYFSSDLLLRVYFCPVAATPATLSPVTPAGISTSETRLTGCDTRQPPHLYFEVERVWRAAKRASAL